MRIGVVVGVLAVVLAAGAAAWFALKDETFVTPVGVREGTAATTPVAPAAAREGADPRAGRAGAAWRKRGEGTVIGTLREHGVERALGAVAVELTAGDDGPATTLQTTTSADGSFRFENVADFGGWTFRAHVEQPKVEVEQGGVSVLPGRTTDLGVIYAIAPATVSGIVVDPDGKPVADAGVQVLRTLRLDKLGSLSDLISTFVDAPVPVDSTTSGADGRFQLSRTPPGTFDLVADAAGFARGTERVSLLPGQAPPDVRLTLTAGHALAGRVVREGAGNLQGIAIRAAPAQGFGFAPFDAFSRVVIANTDAAGAFRFPGLEAGAWELTAIPAGEMTSPKVSVRVPHEGVVDVAIGGDAFLAGRVTGPGDVAVAEARVLVTMPGGDARAATALTSADGSYELRGLASGTTVVVVVEARGYVLSADLETMMRDEGPKVDLVAGKNVFDVRLSTGGTLRGRVVEKGTERGLDGVRVRVASQGFGAIFGGGTESFSAADGRFEVRGLPDGALRASLEKSGWHAVGGGSGNPFVDMIQAAMEGQGESDADAAVDSGKGLSLVATDGGTLERTFEMERAVVVTGKVVDADGAGIAGARVVVKVAQKGPPGLAGMMGDEDVDLSEVFGGLFGGGDDDARVTDASGAFELTAPPGAKFRIRAKAEGFVGASSDELSGAPGAVETRIDGIVVKLSRGASIEGRVTAGGAPVAEAEVRWATPPKGAMAMLGGMGDMFSGKKPPAARTDSDGRFRVAGVTPGKVDVTIRRQGFRVATKSGLEAKDGEALVVDAELDRGAAVAGTVVDDAGRTVAGARVGARLKTDAPRQPMPFARPQADAAGSATSADDGSFRIEGLAPGTFRVRATGNGLLPTEPVETAADAEPIVVRVQRALSIAGTVRCDGKPVAGAQVSATAEDPQRGQRERWEQELEFMDAGDVDVASAMRAAEAARTKADGSFAVEGLAPGTYRLDVRPATGEGAPNVQPQSMKGVAAGGSNVTVECKPGLAIAGSVTLPDGSRALSGTVEATHVGGETAGDATNEETAEPDLLGHETVKVPLRDGAFRLTGLVAGEYRIVVVVPNVGRVRAVAAAGATDVRLKVTQGGVVAGRVVFPDGKPARWAHVAIGAPTTQEGDPVADEDTEFEMTSATGKFSFRYVTEGKWRLTVDATAKGRHWKGTAEVVVDPTQATAVPDIRLADAGPAAQPTLPMGDDEE